MSEKKSPPYKDKTQLSKPLLTDGKTNKRKLQTPASPTDEDDKKNQQKRKRPTHSNSMASESSPEHGGLGSPRGAGGTTMSRLSVPYSERQQMALLMRMQDESTVGDSSPKSPSTGNQVSSSKRTPLDKKVNKRNERGEAPLHMASRKGDYKQTKRLLKAGASVNMKDYAGWTALHEACNSGNLRVARYLLKAGACVNVQGFENDTPLHDASSNGHKKLVLLLLRNGADPYQPNQKGKTAVKVAATTEIEAILCNNGHGFGRESDPDDSEDSSSDSSFSTKEDDRPTVDDESKSLTSATGGKPDGQQTASQTSNSFVSSINIPPRRPSVPVSPDQKMAASPRLFLKLQSSKKSTTSDEQHRGGVLEWNVLPMEGSISEGAPPQSSEPSGSMCGSADAAIPTPTVSHPNTSNSHGVQSSLSPLNMINSSSGKREENATWAKVRGGQLPGESTGNQAGGICPDSTVVSASVNLQRTNTEPFTPRISEFPNVMVLNKSSEHVDDVFTSTKSSTSVSSSYTSMQNSNNSKQQQHHPLASSIPSSMPGPHNSTFCSNLVGVKAPLSEAVNTTNNITNKHLPLSSIPSSSFSLSSLSHQPSPFSPYSSQQHHHQAATRPSQHYHPQQQKHTIPNTNQALSNTTYHMSGRGAFNSQQSTVSSSYAPSSLSSLQVAPSLPSTSLSSTLSSPSMTSPSSTIVSSCVSSHRTGLLGQSSISSCQFSNVSSSVPASSCISSHSPVHTSSTNLIVAASSTSQLGSLRTVGSSKSGGGSIVTGLSDRTVGSSKSGGGSIVTGLSDRTVGSSKIGGGSIVTGLSDRAVAASSIIPVTQVGPITAPAPHPFSAILEDKSDTSSCDSPLRMDVDDPSGGLGSGGSRPSTPKVPPLKIIMPGKQGATGSVTGSSNMCAGVSSSKGNKLSSTKPALPYVLNPVASSSDDAECSQAGGIGESSSCIDIETVSGSVTELVPNCSVGGSSRPSSRPSSRAGSGVGGAVSSSSHNKVGADDDVNKPPNNLDLDDEASRDSEGGHADNTDGSGGSSKADGDGGRPTRTLRSHTAMLQQAQAKDTKERPHEKEKNGGDSVNLGEEADNCSTTRSQKGEDSMADDSNVPHRKRKLRPKNQEQLMENTTTTSITITTSSTITSTAKFAVSQTLEKPPNPYETYLNLRRQIASRHRSLYNVAPKPPSGFKDFLMVNCTYVLQGNATSTLSVPLLNPPTLMNHKMKDFFNQQEKERYRLRLQHVIEREKLMLSIEQEILREHGRAARAMANQRLPFSVCTILREEEIYNLQELEQFEDREKNVRSRYNGRQFLSWLQAVDDKYEKIKQLLLMRHHHEAESLYAVQKLDWEWKLKECGLCDHKISPAIDDLHVPMVSVSNEFDLLPSS